MDWGYKAVLTAMTVAAVLMTAQLFGRRLAGLIAGLPVIAAPSLLWIAAEQGAAYAARCAVGSVAACGAAAVFAVIYERVARRHGLLPSMGAALAGGGLVALALALLTRGEQGLAIALLATTTLCTWALRRLPAAPAEARPTRRLRAELLLTATVAGAISAGIALGSPLLGPFWSGLLASLPVISSAVLVQQHLTAPHAARRRFLRGYATGLVGKAAFATAFAGAAAQLGASLAMALAAVVGIGVSIGLARQLGSAETQAAPAQGVLAPHDL
jgi:hypothetical protein